MSGDQLFQNRDMTTKPNEPKTHERDKNGNLNDDDRQTMLVLEERKRLARDLHDSVNQKLFSLSLIARGLKNQLFDQDDSIMRGICAIEELAQDALIDLRDLIWQLRPVDAEQDFLLLLREYGSKIGLKVSVECQGEEVDLAQKAVEAILRIGQEALNNIRKHSETDQAFIRFHITREEVKLTIMDQGCGFAARSRNLDQTFGISNMKERAAQIGGNVNVYSSPGNGTVVSLIAPVLEGWESG